MRRNKLLIKILQVEAVILLITVATHQMIDRFTSIVFILLPMLAGAYSFIPRDKMSPHISKNSIYEMSKNEFLSNIVIALKSAGWKNVNLTSNNELVCVDAFGLDEKGNKTLIITRKNDFTDYLCKEEAEIIVEVAGAYPKKDRTILITTSPIHHSYVQAFAYHNIECVDGEGLLDLLKERRLEALR